MSNNTLKNIILGVVMAVTLAIQSANILAIGRVQPDLMLLMVLLFSFSLGEAKGEVFAFFMGLLLDAMSGGLFGINAFIFTFIAWFTAVYRKYIQAADVAAFLIYIFFATFIKYFFTVIFYWMFKQGNILDGFLVLKMFLEGIYNIILGGILFYITPWLFKRKHSEF